MPGPRRDLTESRHLIGPGRFLILAQIKGFSTRDHETSTETADPQPPDYKKALPPLKSLVRVGLKLGDNVYPRVNNIYLQTFYFLLSCKILF